MVSNRMNWDKFSFDYRFDYEHLFDKLVNIEAYREAALNLVLPPDWQTMLDRLNRVRAIHGTTALEGNPLSESEVAHQMDVVDADREKSKAKSGRATKEQLQIRNSAEAQKWVRERFTPDSPPLRLNDILEMHRIITADSDTEHNQPGKLRKFSVVVGSPDMGGVHRGAPSERLDDLMDQFIGFVNSRKLIAEGPILRALLAHFFLVTIHPFGDGNGRVSRLVEAGILFRENYNIHGFYGLSNYFYRNEKQYKIQLQKARQKQPFDLTDFITFGVEGFAAELKGINNFIKTKLNRVVYRQMLHRAFNRRIGPRRKLLNQREWNLLDFLLNVTEPSDPFSENPSRRVAFDELQKSAYITMAYRKVTPRTFHRELTRLSELGFVTLSRDEQLGMTLELDFNAIGKY